MKEEILSGKMFWAEQHQLMLKFDPISLKFLALQDIGNSNYWIVYARIKNEWKTYFELEYYQAKLKFYTSIYDHKSSLTWVAGINLTLSDCTLV